MEQFKKERKLKVYETTNVYQGSWHTSTKYKRVPQIRLQGLWLEQLGFEPGTELKVECEGGRIVIQKI